MKEEKELESLNIDSTIYKTRLSGKFKNRKPYSLPDPSRVLSFISGTVLEILVKEGQEVRKGDDLMILEAMKMQNRLKSQQDGLVKKVCVKRGDKVIKGILLLEIEQIHRIPS
ncbi:MAG TPA: acetyl-CoA carboxylase biotin carboxyl carrier protein subunit [Bacteroidales bacterium]|mgnify:CR=1 FL=1|jgi:biotin carboxyl carrier protein|nr:biotin/lipoyl-binding protein [Bacteroidales bacterium]OQB60705.1 MAG: Glutaconyl-CoA decarboxylase subunit gamma [Bacteroidetes bacterium ADurb.Bin145]NMD02225.1 acetyl-CoA carboxylase biotin carboxyl carrier protein subunit [Bacteroidales bacterium]HOU01406.1 acetyl-CoA carboxylase biotin carboxyl carrier protein subunit [Bacteroidales bacterium]HQG62091.1 acetyl-CoA carboxylase biotin carboxyl carrier protein subunit [Bacteroidales bacterium]